MTQFFKNLFRTKKTTTTTTNPTKNRRVRLSLEALEDRVVLDAAVGHTGRHDEVHYTCQWGFGCAAGLYSEDYRVHKFDLGDIIIVGDDGHADKVLVGKTGQDEISVQVWNYADSQGTQVTSIENYFFPASSVRAVKFWGQAGDDYFVNDTTIPTAVDGGSGRDMILSGRGYNEIHGGPDHDTISLRTGGLFALAGGYVNTVYGDDGFDFIYGSQWKDYISGGEGDDYIDGDAGDDVIDGGAGSDNLIGGAGKDSLSGQGGLDYIFGGTGDDTLNGGFDGQADQLFGGDGFDTFIEHKFETVEQEGLSDSDNNYTIMIVQHSSGATMGFSMAVDGTFESMLTLGDDGSSFDLLLEQGWPAVEAYTDTISESGNEGFGAGLYDLTPVNVDQVEVINRDDLFASWSDSSETLDLNAAILGRADYLGADAELNGWKLVDSAFTDLDWSSPYKEVVDPAMFDAAFESSLTLDQAYAGVYGAVEADYQPDLALESGVNADAYLAADAGYDSTIAETWSGAESAAYSEIQDESYVAVEAGFQSAYAAELESVSSAYQEAYVEATPAPTYQIAPQAATTYTTPTFAQTVSAWTPTYSTTMTLRSSYLRW